jgi:hypothetical protein
MYWAIWNFDPQNRPLSSSKPASAQKSKNRFFSANIAPIIAYGDSKRIRRAFLIISSYQNVKNSFREFRTAEIRFFSFFRWKIIDFQIDEDMLVCPKIAKISKSSLYTFSCPKAMGNRLGNSKKWSGHPKKVFRALFDSCWGHFDGKISYFDVFLKCFDDFVWSQFLGTVRARCMGAQESKKIEIIKNALKHLKLS